MEGGCWAAVAVTIRRRRCGPAKGGMSIGGPEDERAVREHLIRSWNEVGGFRNSKLVLLFF